MIWSIGSFVLWVLLTFGLSLVMILLVLWIPLEASKVRSEIRKESEVKSKND